MDTPVLKNETVVTVQKSEDKPQFKAVDENKKHSFAPNLLRICAVIMLVLTALGAVTANIYISLSQLDLSLVITQLLFSDTLDLPSLENPIQIQTPPQMPSEENKTVCRYTPPSFSLTSDDLSALYSYTSADLPEFHYPIKAKDLSSKAEFALEASNETDYSLELHSYLDLPIYKLNLEETAKKYGSDAPVILIIHTHGTEAYSNGTSYEKSDNCRTTDITQNVVSVGAVMADHFNSVGIPTLHCETMFDEKSYSNAYTYAEAAIREFVAIYPSIQYVFDVHRDSLTTADNTKLRPVTLVNGRLTAQFMSVIGSDEVSKTHSNWERNLAFACQLQRSLYKVSPTFPRRMSIRSASYNQKYTEGSLLLEIGSCGNTLEEAKQCALFVAQSIAELVRALP